MRCGTAVIQCLGDVLIVFRSEKRAFRMFDDKVRNPGLSFLRGCNGRAHQCENQPCSASHFPVTPPGVTVFKTRGVWKILDEIGLRKCGKALLTRVSTVPEQCCYCAA